MVIFVLKSQVIKERINLHFKWTKTWMGLMVILAFLFPGHLMCISVVKLNAIWETEKNKAKKCIKDSSKTIENVDLHKFQYAKLQASIQSIEKDYCSATQYKTIGGICRTIIEHLPSCVLLLSLWLMGLDHKPLKMFLIDGFMAKFSAYYKWIILFTSIQLVFSISSSILSSR